MRAASGAQHRPQAPSTPSCPLVRPAGAPACNRHQRRHVGAEAARLSVVAAADAGGGSIALQQPHAQQHPGAASSWGGSSSMGQLDAVRACSSHGQLLAWLQQQQRAASADVLVAVLYRASAIAKQHARSSRHAANSSSSNRSDAAAAQQLVSLSLSLLLQAQEQLTARHLSNCLLSMAVLCGRHGPVAGAMAVGGSSGLSGMPQQAAPGQQQAHVSQQQQAQQPGGGGGGMLQLITPPGSRALGQLLHAAAPHHQLQQLLEVGCGGGMLAAAQPGALVDVLYGLAVLHLRPAPGVLQQLLAAAQARLAAAAGGPLAQRWSSRQLAQLLWAAAALQLRLPEAWLAAYWAASERQLAAGRAQDVANTAWAAGTLALAPPAAWLSSLHAAAASAAGSMSGQGLANSLWGLAVLRGARPDAGTLAALLQACVAGVERLAPRDLATVTWAAARCMEQQQQQQQCRALLAALLGSAGALLPRLAPLDWSCLMVALGRLRLAPGGGLLAALWRRTPAGFSTSLNPHSPGPSSTAWSAQALANVAWGAARLGAAPPKAWLRGFEAAALLRLAELSDQGLANVAWAFGRLGHAPSTAWAGHYWRHAQRLLASFAAAAAAAAGGDAGAQQAGAQAAGGPDVGADADADVPGLGACAMHVVMVLQACAALRLLPPAAWLAPAAMQLAAAAPLLLRGRQSQQQAHLQALTSAVHALAGLAQLTAGAGDADCSSAVTGAACQLLEQLVSGGAARAGGSRSSVPLQALGHMDVLLLLAALQRLHSVAPSSVAVRLLARCQVLLPGCSTGQLVRMAGAAAAIACDQSGAAAAPRGPQLWHAVADAAAGQQQLAPHAYSSGSRQPCLAQQLVVQLTAALPAMDAGQISSSCVTVARLSRTLYTPQLPVAGSSSSSSACATAAFAAAAGAAVGARMGQVAPGQRAGAVYALALLGWRPDGAWLEQLLLHSSCDLAACSAGDQVRLLQAVTLLLQQQQGLAVTGDGGGRSSSSSRAAAVQQVEGWLGCWCAESARAMPTATPAQLAAVAIALPRLLAALKRAQQGAGRQQQPRQHVPRRSQAALPALPAGWRAAYLSAAQAALPRLSSGGLVAVAAAGSRLRLSPGHADWCAALAQEAAARTAGGGRPAAQQLALQQVGQLALALSRLGYAPPRRQQEALLEHARAACSGAGVRPRQLARSLLLLERAGWRPSEAWLDGVAASPAAARLRARDGGDAAWRALRAGASREPRYEVAC